MSNEISQPVFRFAPSPNGYLHLGHAYSALLNFDMARKSGGRFLLRMEDIDIERCKPEYEQAIYEDLAWLGISWEEPVRRQSENFGDYELALDRLADRRLIFPCFCSRNDIKSAISTVQNWPLDPDGSPLYPGTCKHLSDQEKARKSAGRYAAYRIDMAQALSEVGMFLGWREFGGGEVPQDVNAEPSVWGDAVVARRDIPTSYHIAVVVDDALQGVTDIVRGRDLFAATSIHRLLQALLDLPAPNYHHHKLFRDDEGKKLSKSQQSVSIRDFRAEGVSPAAIREHLGFAPA